MAKKKTFHCNICQKWVQLESYKAEIIKERQGDDKNRDIELFCPNNLNHYKIKKDRDYKKIPIEKKQVFMNFMKDGRNIGDASKLAGLSSEMGAEILFRQIKNRSYIDFEIKNEVNS